ncbi:MAG: PaaI family thioesterase [Desulfuromonadaceae bacterium]|nr:PaaI family thioesterase [Desulfuromonadaceae bacterium]
MNHKIKNQQNISKHCMVCGIENPYGLKTRFYETEENEVIALFSPQDVHQSYPDIAHGGVTAAILDETIGRAIMAFYDQNTFGITIELNVKYKKPVPLGVELKAVGRITKDSGRIFAGTGELYLPNGELAATAEGKYLKRNLEQITDTEFINNEWFPPVEDLPDGIEL